LIGRNAVAQVRGERRIAAMKERQAAYAERQALQEQKVDATGLVKSRDANLKVMQQDAQQTAQAKRANEALDRRSLSEQKQDATGLMQARKSPNEGDRAPGD
jgi:Fic family protein